MIYEVKKKLVSCNLSIGFLKDLETYMRKQAEELSEGYKTRIQNRIIDCKKRIKEHEKEIEYYKAKEEQESTSQQDRIKQYEGYIEAELEEIKELECELPYNFRIQLEDKYGKESIQSFDEVNQSYFDNQVHTVMLKADYKIYSKRFEINVEFSEEDHFSYVAVIIDDSNAKEKTQGIVHEIQRRTENHKSYHRFFYGTIHSIMYVLLIGGLFGHAIVAKKFSSIYSHLYLWFIGAFIVYVMVKQISPYSILPTVKNEKLHSFKKWGFGLLVTFMIWAGNYITKNADTIFHVDNNVSSVENNQTGKK